MRVAYFGLPLGALLLLEDGAELDFAVLPKLDAPGRRRLARRLGPRLVDAREFDTTAELDERLDRRFSDRPPDLLVSWFHTRLLPARWLCAPLLGAIGVHPSLLPKHRGPNPFFAAIDAGDAVTGVSLHRLTARYDEGDVLFTESLPVGERDSWQLARALDRPSLRLLRGAVRAFRAGVVPHATSQVEADATWAAEPSGELLRVDWTWPAERVLRRVRALSPVPGVALRIEAFEFFVTRAFVAADFPTALLPGEAAITKAGVVVRTGDGAIGIDRAIADTDEGDVAELGRAAVAARAAAALGRRAR